MTLLGHGITDTRHALPAAYEAALHDLARQPLSGVDKGLPNSELIIGDVGRQGWNVLAGDIPLPVMVLHVEALKHNIALMQSYCDQHGAWLAPHGKTMMSPQLWAEQLRAGSWAITVANIAQLQVACAFGVPRVLVANEMIAPYDARYLAEQLQINPALEIYVLVDSLAGVEALARELRAARISRPLPVLVELGMEGGRCGTRSVEELIAVAQAVIDAEPVLRLVGVEGYEGIIHAATYAETLKQVDHYLERLRRAARAVRDLLPDRAPFLVSAGGSVYFDRVVAMLGRAQLPEMQLVLRSGGYVTHDSSFYDTSSPFGSQSPRPVGDEHLIPALEVWSTVISRPEPELAILSMGQRDMPVDIELPLPLYRSRGNGDLKTLDQGYAVVQSNDQHAYLRLPADSDLAVGDLIGCGISHPCTAFDKWRTLLVVDAERNVVDALRTYF